MTAEYTVLTMRHDLDYVERRIAEMEASDSDWTNRLAEYRACAAELRALIEAETA